MGRLKKKYDTKIINSLSKDLKIDNKMAVPSVAKVVVNMGIGEIASNKEQFAQMKADLALITGQQPSIRAAKRAVASFAIRKGMPVGLKVTLRKDRMYEFLDRLFSVVLPRLRDFKGVSVGGFDKNGNYTLGIYEHLVFPEIDLAKSKAHGLEVTIVTNAKNSKKAKALLEKLGMPFEKNDK